MSIFVICWRLCVRVLRHQDLRCCRVTLEWLSVNKRLAREKSRILCMIYWLLPIVVSSYYFYVVFSSSYARGQPVIGQFKASFLTDIVSARWLANVSLLALWGHRPSKQEKQSPICLGFIRDWVLWPWVYFSNGPFLLIYFGQAKLTECKPRNSMLS